MYLLDYEIVLDFRLWNDIIKNIILWHKNKDDTGFLNSQDSDRNIQTMVVRMGGISGLISVSGLSGFVLESRLSGAVGVSGFSGGVGMSRLSGAIGECGLSVILTYKRFHTSAL